MSSDSREISSFALNSSTVFEFTTLDCNPFPTVILLSVEELISIDLFLVYSVFNWVFSVNEKNNFISISPVVDNSKYVNNV